MSGVNKTHVQQEKELIRAYLATHRDTLDELTPRILVLKLAAHLKKILKRDLVLSKAKIGAFTGKITTGLSDAQPSPSSPGKRFEHDGKLYAVGDIINVGYGPYFAKPGAGGRHKKVRALDMRPDRILESGGDDDPDGDDYEGEAAGYDDEDPPTSPGSPESPGFDAPSLSPPPPVKGKYVVERGIDYTYKRVSVFSGHTQQLAREFGLDLAELRLVPVPYKRRVMDAELLYRGYEQYEVVPGPSGKLTIQLYRPYSGRKITILDPDYLPPPVPKKYSPRKLKVPQAPAHYKGSLKFGDRVKFVKSRTGSYEGAVLRAGNMSFDIVTVLGQEHQDIPYFEVSKVEVEELPASMQGSKVNEIVIIPSIAANEKPRKLVFAIDSDTRPPKSNPRARALAPPPNKFVKFDRTHLSDQRGTIFGFNDVGFVVGGPSITTQTVPYDHPTLERIAAPEKKLPIKYAKVVAEDYLHKKVTDKTRENVVDLLFGHLSSIMPGMFASALDEDAELNAVRARVNWDVYNGKLPAWEQYYATQYRQWVYGRYVEDIRSRTPDFSSWAKEEVLRRVDPTILVNELTSVFGDDMFDGDGVDLVRRMKYRSNEPGYIPTVLTVYFQTGFSRIGLEELEKLKGKNLARYVVGFVMTYLRRYPPDPRHIEARAKQQWIVTQFEAIVPTSEDQIIFDQEHLETLKHLYSEAGTAYKKAKDDAKAYEDMRRVAEERLRRNHREQTKLKIRAVLDGRALSDAGLKLYKDVVALENAIFLLSEEGLTNFEYLRRVHEIDLFLDPTSGPGKYAEFFRAKIATGLYPIDQLASATMFHKFPELFTNTKLDDAEYKIALGKLGFDIYRSIIEFVSMWLLQDTVTRRKAIYGSGFQLPWGRYVQDVSTSGCGRRIKKDAVLTGDPNNTEDYDCGKKPGADKYECTAKTELIPHDDLVICYSDEKFVCLSINDILHAISERKSGVSNPANPVTGIAYTSTFLDRMEHRYGDLLAKGRFPKRTLRFELGLEALLFGQPAAFSSDSPEAESSPAKSKIETPSSLDGAFALADGKKLVLYFYEEWMTMHGKLTGELEALEKRDDVALIKIDLSEEAGAKLFEAVKLRKKIPTFVLYSEDRKKIGQFIVQKSTTTLHGNLWSKLIS